VKRRSALAVGDGKTELRLGKAGDSLRLATILRTGEAEKHPWFDGRDQQAQMLSEAMNFSSAHAEQALVLLVDGHIHGFAYVGANDHHIFWFYIDRRYRGVGRGKKMLDELKSKHEFLTLDVWIANEGAVAFYQREGFVPIPRPENLTDGQVRMRWPAPAKQS
jgi:ribosomal protein S18 acetylase RimI-like enzyme